MCMTISATENGTWKGTLTVTVICNSSLEVEVELLHAVCGDEDLEAGVAPGERLRHLQEPTPGVLLE